MTNLIEMVKEPEAEISLVEGQTKIIQTRRELTRIVIANPPIADVELLTDQPNSRLLNLYGKTFGTTSLTIWDQTNRPVSFLVRVTLDTKDLESRIRQAFPGAEVKVRQVGPQIILDGQVARLEDDVGHPPARHDDAHEQPDRSGRTAAVAAVAVAWAAAAAAWAAVAAWAAAAWAAAAWAAAAWAAAAAGGGGGRAGDASSSIASRSPAHARSCSTSRSPRSIAARPATSA